MSEHIENYFLPNELSNLINLGKKHLQRHFCCFRHDRKPSRIPVQTLEPLSNENRKVIDNNNCL